jgi:tRNA/tmRNA/rRNA uracil-C5-methylase (TrmA/RlmC/RlmD family)
MLKALQRQLERKSEIALYFAPRKPKLLELYCGCGAHTVALAKSGIFESIVALELDQRLVNVAQRNILLNQLDKIVSVVSNDAGTWTKTNTNQDFDVILVDPPRQGLSENVCRRAIEARSCQDMLYISCAYEALVRDLQVLDKAFDVIDCTIIDLFPTMEGVESLVHLRRRKAGK